MPPLLFHEVHAERLKLFKDGDVIRRVPSSDYKRGTAFSNRPVKIGEKVRLRLLKIGEGYLGFITFGFTKHNPESLKPINRSLPIDINSSAARRAGFWSAFADHRVYKEDDELFFCVNSLGKVQYGVNDETKGTFDIGDQCDRIQLWALVDTNVDNMIIQLVNPPLKYRAENGLQLFGNEESKPESIHNNIPKLQNGSQDILPPLIFHSESGSWAKVSLDCCMARRLTSSSKQENSLPYLFLWDAEILPPLSFTTRFSISTPYGIVRTQFAVFSSRTVTIGDKICLRFLSGSGDFILGFTDGNPDASNEEKLYSNFKYWGVQLERASLEDLQLYYFVNSKGEICFGTDNEELGIGFCVVDTKIPLWAILILPDDAVVQFVDPRSTPVGPAIPTKFSELMRFHPLHGNQDAVSQDGSKAVLGKRDEKGSGTVFTYRPVQINERISLRIAVTEKCYNNSCLLTFGFTNHEPTSLIFENSKGLNSRDKGRILLKGSKIIFNIYVDSSGEMHFWCEGDSERRSISAIDVTSCFWMFMKSAVPANVYFVETTSEPPPCKYVHNLSPMDFHYIHGENVVRQKCGVQCIRNKATEDTREGLAFSSKPIERNKKICLRILANPKETSSIQIGVTTIKPKLPKRIFQEPNNETKIWIRNLEKEYCKENNNIYFYVNSSGDVFYGINGDEMGILVSGVDVSRDIWALVEISGLSTIVMFTNAIGIRQIIDDHTFVDQRQTGSMYFLQKHEEFNIESIEADNEMRIEKRPANDNSMKFNTIHGRNVRVSKDGFEAQLVDEEDFRSGLAFTSRPLAVDEQISIRMKNYECKSCLLIFGFTKVDPKYLTEAVRRNIYKPYLIEISLALNTNLHIRMSPSLDVHFWTDEFQSVTNYFEEIGNNGPVWLLIELPNMPATMKISRPIATCQPPRGTTYNLHPINFHTVHGSNVRTFTKMTAEVECTRKSRNFDDGLAFSSRTISVKEKIHLRILSDRTRDMKINLGFTNLDPSTLAGPNNFCKQLPPSSKITKSLDKIYYRKNNDICFYVDSSGDINLEVDGQERGIIMENVDISSPLWALVEISGPVTLLFLNGYGRFRFGEHSSYSYLIDDSRAASLPMPVEAVSNGILETPKDLTEILKD